MPATAYTMTGPGATPVGVASTPFSLVANGSLPSAVHVTIASTLGATITPNPVTLPAVANPAATFTVTESAQGSDTISATNDGSLANPASLTMLSAPPIAAMIAISGDAVAPPTGTRVSVVPDTYAPILLTLAHAPGPLTAASLQVKPNPTTTTALLTKAGLIVDPGTTQTDGSYTAKVLFNCVEADTDTMPAGTAAGYSFNVQATVSAAGGSHTVPAIEAGVWTSVSGSPAG